jgi:BolA protein
MGRLTDAIKEKLAARFNPSQLEVIDESAKHAGHAGAAEHAAEGKSAESHVHVIIVAESFAGMSTLAKHRAVLEAVKDEVEKLHAFSLEAKA